MSWSDITFTFPFTIATLIVAVVAYVVTTPIVTTKLNKIIKFVIWAALAVTFSLVFTVDYGPRFLLAIGIMVASRMRLTQKGLLKEILMIVITLVTAMLFVGLR